LDGFLITEAVRGEGALLLNGAGERFVDELAPRDEVALAVHRVRLAGDEVRLDMREVDPAHFPNVTAALQRAGIDPRADLVPVALAELAANDPFPLARAIARSALARTESRGAHQRADHPSADPSFDGMHSVTRGETAAQFQGWQ